MDTCGQNCLLCSRKVIITFFFAFSTFTPQLMSKIFTMVVMVCFKSCVQAEDQSLGLMLRAWLSYDQHLLVLYYSASYTPDTLSQMAAGKSWIISNL